MLWFSEIAVSSHNSMSSSIFAPAEALSKLGWRQVLHLPAISKLVHHLTSCILQKACKEQRNCHFQFTTVLTCGSYPCKKQIAMIPQPDKLEYGLSQVIETQFASAVLVQSFIPELCPPIFRMTQATDCPTIPASWT